MIKCPKTNHLSEKHFYNMLGTNLKWIVKGSILYAKKAKKWTLKLPKFWWCHTDKTVITTYFTGQRLFKLHHDTVIVITFGILNFWNFELYRSFWGQKLANFVFSRIQPTFCPLTGPIKILETQIIDKIASTSRS